VSLVGGCASGAGLPPAMLPVGAVLGEFGHGEDGPDDGAALAPGEGAAIGAIVGGGGKGDGELGWAETFGTAFAIAVGAADEAAV
jgi:hypothetical protein